jgi:hypothetical protein
MDLNGPVSSLVPAEGSEEFRLNFYLLCLTLAFRVWNALVLVGGRSTG